MPQDSNEEPIVEMAYRVIAEPAELPYLLEDVLDRMEAQSRDRFPTLGLSTGFPALDQKLTGLPYGGFGPGELIAVGGRPATGKSSFALSVVRHVGVRLKKPVLLVTPQHRATRLAEQLLIAESEVDARKFRVGRFHGSEWDALGEAIKRLGEAPIFLDDHPNPSVDDIRHQASMLRRNRGLTLVVIDYLQLMRGRRDAESRDAELSEVARGLKVLAGELAVPTVVLSQLSSGVERRRGRRPRLFDFRDCSALEDSDVVLMLRQDDAAGSQPGRCKTWMVHCLKAPGGQTGNVRLTWLENGAGLTDGPRVQGS